jgi:methionyl-tRNA formyltransferase
MAGDTRTGVCIMQMEAGLDTGPVLLREETAIGPRETAADLHDRLAADGARLLVEALSGLDTLIPQPQSDMGVTYAAKIDKAEARIDWTRPAADLDAHIRGLSPSPGAWFMAGEERVKLLLAEPVAGAGTPGAMLAEDTVACGSGALRLLRLQRAGKPAMAAGDFLRGFPLVETAPLA